MCEADIPSSKVFEAPFRSLTVSAHEICGRDRPKRSRIALASPKFDDSLELVKTYRSQFALLLALVILLQGAQASLDSGCNSASANMAMPTQAAMMAAHAEHEEGNHHKAADHQCKPGCDCAGNCGQISHISLLPSLKEPSSTPTPWINFASITGALLLAHSSPPIRPPDSHQKI